MGTLGYFNDDPIDGSESAPDLLGRDTYARNAVTLLEHVRAQSPSGVLALIGPWGSGKSSLLGMITRQLTRQTDSRWAVRELNPWMYSDVDSLTLALFSEIRAALPKGEQWSDTRSKIAGFGRTVASFSKIASLAGIDASGALESVSDAIAGDESPSAVKKQVEDALRAANRPILILIDDLDRVTPSELLVVFKLVRLVGRLPNIYYLLCYDERTLLDVLRRTDLVGNDETRAQEFLEKIVQVRLDLPAFRERDAVAIVDQGIRDLLAAHGMTLDPKSMERLGHAYDVHLKDRLTTPRSIKRYFGQVNAGLASMAGNIDLVDFLLVTFLRTMEPGAYNLLRRHRAQLTGTDYLPRAERDKQLPIWQDRLTDAGVSPGNREGILTILSLLFPAIAELTRLAVNDANRPCSVCSADYFDRYVTFAVPGDDLPEADFATAINQILADAPGHEREELLKRLRTDTHRITRRIRRHPTAVSSPNFSLLGVLADAAGDLDAPAETLGLLTPDSALRSLATDLLANTPDDSRAVVLTRMSRTPAGAHLATVSLLRLEDRTQSGDLSGPEPEWVQRCRESVETGIEQHLQDAGSAPADLSDIQIDLLLTWRFLGSERPMTWIHERLRSGWDLLDLLMQLTPAARVIGGTGESRIVGEISLESFDVLVGLEFILSKLADQIDGAGPHVPSPFHVPDNPERRRQRILDALRDHRERAGAASVEGPSPEDGSDHAAPLPD
ncbi:P-loop NTPase fold protein [Nonomuraea sp. NPDC049269]|uniref:KAP family P-loop NTPase fold protein n=1 Tax=Nonomuraea sp. NPDC049269 TaxID=3364349 RepID=UPI00371F5B85